MGETFVPGPEFAKPLQEQHKSSKQGHSRAGEERLIYKDVHKDIRKEQCPVITRVVLLALLAISEAAWAEAPADSANAPAASAKQALTLQAHVSPDPVVFAQPFDLVLEIDRDEGQRLALPDALPESKTVRRAGPIKRDIRPIVPVGGADAGETPPTGKAGTKQPARVHETIRIPYLALDTSDVHTPDLVLTTPEGEKVEVDALELRVTDPEADAGPGAALSGQNQSGQNQPGQKPPGLELAQSRTHYLYDVEDSRPWALTAAALLSLLAFFAWRFLAKRQQFFMVQTPEAPAPLVPIRPAHEVALDRLDALMAEGLLKNGQVAPFVARLMDEVLRDYLQARFNVAATTHTTAELAEDLLEQAYAGLDVTVIRSLLEDTDLVKFARAELQVEVAHGMASKVRLIVEQTAQRSEEGLPK